MATNIEFKAANAVYATQFLASMLLDMSDAEAEEYARDVDLDDIETIIGHVKKHGPVRHGPKKCNAPGSDTSDTSDHNHSQK